MICCRYCHELTLEEACATAYIGRCSKKALYCCGTERGHARVLIARLTEQRDTLLKAAECVLANYTHVMATECDDGQDYEHVACDSCGDDCECGILGLEWDVSQAKPAPKTEKADGGDHG